MPMRIRLAACLLLWPLLASADAPPVAVPSADATVVDSAWVSVPSDPDRPGPHAARVMPSAIGTPATNGPTVGSGISQNGQMSS